MENYYLNYIQTMALILKISEIKKNDASFNDEIVMDFENYCLNKHKEILLTQMDHKLFKIIDDRYEIPKNVLEHLTNLTGVNVFDKSVMRKYKVIIKDKEKEFLMRQREQFKSMKSTNSIKINEEFSELNQKILKMIKENNSFN